jgi:hypothetical protein
MHERAGQRPRSAFLPTPPRWRGGGEQLHRARAGWAILVRLSPHASMTREKRTAHPGSEQVLPRSEQVLPRSEQVLPRGDSTHPCAAQTPHGAPARHSVSPGLRHAAPRAPTARRWCLCDLPRPHRAWPCLPGMSALLPSRPYPEWGVHSAGAAMPSLLKGPAPLRHASSSARDVSPGPPMSGMERPFRGDCQAMHARRHRPPACQLSGPPRSGMERPFREGCPA